MQIRDLLTWEAMRGAHPEWWVLIQSNGKKYIVACGKCADELKQMHIYVSNRFTDGSRTDARWSVWMSPDFPEPRPWAGETHKHCDYCGRRHAQR